MGLGSLSLLYAIHSLLLFFQHMLCYQRSSLLEVETKDLFMFLFSLQTFNRTPNRLFFLEISLYDLVKIPMHFPISFASSSTIFLFLMRLFKICHLKKLFSFFLCFFFRFIRLSYSAALIKILWILFTCILFFLGFLTTFSSLVDILKYLYFLILAPSVRCDPSQSYLTKKKNFNSSQIRTTRNIFISKGYQK